MFRFRVLEFRVLNVGDVRLRVWFFEIEGLRV